MGIERLMELVKMPEGAREGYYIGALCDEALDIFDVTIAKRKKHFVSTSYDAKSLKNHLKQADKNNVKFCVCVGKMNWLKRVFGSRIWKQKKKQC